MSKLKYFICLLIIYCIGIQANANDIRFVQVSDSHFSPSEGAVYKQEVQSPKNTLEKTVSDINTLNNVDFVVFTGDNIDQANPDALKAFLKITNKLKYPYYLVIGNHEVFKNQHFTKKDYMKTVRKYSKSYKPRHANYVFKRKGIVFIVVDGAKEVVPGPAGYFKKDTLKWLDKKLTKYRHEDVIIFQHFPIVEPYYNRTHMTYNVKDYEVVLDKYDNVIGIFSGHFHSNGENMRNGVYHASCPALVVSPHQYKVVDINFPKKAKILKDKPQIYTQLRTVE